MAKKTLEKKPEKVFAWADATPEERKKHTTRRMVLVAVLQYFEGCETAALPQRLKGEFEDAYRNRKLNFAKAVACQALHMSPETWHGTFGQTNERELNRLFNTIRTQDLLGIVKAFNQKNEVFKQAVQVAAKYTTTVN